MTYNIKTWPSNFRLDPRKIPIIVAVLLFCLPIIIDVFISGKTAPIRYFAADTFYYFTVARNYSNLGVFTFDQTYPTNGFHPLWQLITAFLYKVTAFFNLPEIGFFYLILILSIVLIISAIVFTGVSFIRIREKLNNAFILFPVGIYALLLAPVWAYAVLYLGFTNKYEGPLPLYGTLWSFINGMESSLAIFAFALILLLYVSTPSKSRRHNVVLGLLTGFLVLSRLDLIFVAGGIWLIYLENITINKSRQSFGDLLLFTAFVSIPIITYLAINYTYMGTFMPVSGMAKSTFPSLNPQNLQKLIQVLLTPFSYNIWLDDFYRVAQLVIPGLFILIGGFILAFEPVQPFKHFYNVRRRKLDQIDKFLLYTGIGILGLTFYNFFFVNFYGAGHWYFPISIVVSFLIFISIIDRTWVLKKTRRWVQVFTGLIVMVIFITLHRQLEYHQGFNHFYFDESKQVKAFYADDQPKFVEYDDGIFAFSTGFPTMSGMGLMVDHTAHLAYQQNNLIELAFNRGFDRITSVVYVNFSQIESEHPLMSEIFQDHEFQLTPEYESQDGSFGIIRYEISSP